MDQLLNKILDKLNKIEVQQDENTQTLKSLEHKTDTIKAEQENIKHDRAKALGELSSIRKDLVAVEYVTGKNMSDIAQLKSVK